MHFLLEAETTRSVHIIALLRLLKKIPENLQYNRPRGMLDKRNEMFFIYKMDVSWLINRKNITVQLSKEQNIELVVTNVETMLKADEGILLLLFLYI